MKRKENHSYSFPLTPNFFSLPNLNETDEIKHPFKFIYIPSTFISTLKQGKGSLPHPKYKGNVTPLSFPHFPILSFSLCLISFYPLQTQKDNIS